jgi:hypothetical protein
MPERHGIAKEWVNVCGIEHVGPAHVNWYAWLFGVRFPPKNWEQHWTRISLIALSIDRTEQEHLGNEIYHGVLQYIPLERNAHHLYGRARLFW